ncbi:MAG: DUF4139 domain-containing protein [Phenylobacterium sp.]
MRPRPALAAMLLLSAGQAAAQTVAGPPTAASVTIYRDSRLQADDLDELDRSQGLALISETRTVEVPAGVSRIAFAGVADTLVPETVTLQGLPGAMVERNEDFDLLSPGSLVERSIGRTVQVVETPRRGAISVRQAVIRSGPNGVVLDSGGQIEALGCGGPPTRLVFDQVPPGLGDRPTFSVLADVPKAGRYTVRLSYLATGFTWSADYVARIRPDGRTLDFSGWLTLSNKSAAGFAQAPTQVVAGDLERDVATKPPEVYPKPITQDCWGQITRYAQGVPLAVPMVERRMAAPGVVSEIVVTGSKRATVSDLGDYKLYTLPEPTTVAARQTKQVAFLEQPAVPFERIYVYRIATNDPPDPQDGAGEPPEVVLRLQNKAQFGLGKPLPSGVISVMQPGGGGLVLAGQHAIRDTPVGLPLEVAIGRAMDIVVAPRVVEDDSHGDTHSLRVAVAVTNAKPAPVTLELRQPRIGDDFTVVRASQSAVAKEGDEVWTLHLAPGERGELTYTMRYKD